MPKVSIVIPVYNIKGYMSASVQSAISQTEQDIEIILVDDGSTDGSQQLCDQYAEADSRISVIHKVNGGLSSARNAGIKTASAQYVLLLDGDDYLHEKAVERLLDVAAAYPSDIIQFCYMEVPEVVSLPVLGEVEVEAQATTAEEAFRFLYQWGGVCASGCTKLFRKQLLEDIPFETIRHEDEMWCTRAFPRNLKITYIPDVLYGYVIRSGSIIHSSFNRHKLNSFTISEERLKVLQFLKLDDLVSCEFRKLFCIILSLYNEAKNANDQVSVTEIHNLFEKRKNEIKRYAQLQGKFRLIFHLMCWNFAAADIYRVYWKMKGL